MDFETKSSYSIRVQSEDSGNQIVVKVFTITVNDLNETPTDITLSNYTVDENDVANAAVGHNSIKRTILIETLREPPR